VKFFIFFHLFFHPALLGAISTDAGKFRCSTSGWQCDVSLRGRMPTGILGSLARAYGDKNPAPYRKEYSLCDTIVIADDMFVLINHEIAAYGDAERYPVLAAGFTPHSANGALWLDLFGF
jgi:hypothetical protein